MKQYNVILVYNHEDNNVLMCERVKDPYKGKLNLVGGKIEENEEHLSAAYRELKEETGITKEDIKLLHLMDFNYVCDNINLEVYVGRLNKEVQLVEEVNSLKWIPKTEDFTDLNRFAGDGNIAYMMETVKFNKDKLLD